MPRMFTLEKRKTALLIIDMQNDFVRDGGVVQTRAAKATLGAHRKLIDFFHRANMPVIYTRALNRSENIRVRRANLRRPEGTKLNPLVPGHKRYFPDAGRELEVADVVEEIYPREGDHVVDKDLYDAFCGTNLDLLLRTHGIRYLLLTGTATEVCVDATAKGAFNLGYETALISDAVSSDASPTFLKELLVEFAKRWGRVMKSEEALEELSRSL